MLPIEALAEIPALATLPRGDLVELARAGAEKRCGPKDVVISEGERGDCVYLIVSGELAAIAPDVDGGSRTLSTMGPGEVFGEVAVLDGRPRSATVVARTEARLVVIGGSTFVNLIGSSAPFALAMMALLAQRIRSRTLVAAGATEPRDPRDSRQ